MHVDALLLILTAWVSGHLRLPGPAWLIQQSWRGGRVPPRLVSCWSPHDRRESSYVRGEEMHAAVADDARGERCAKRRDVAGGAGAMGQMRRASFEQTRPSHLARSTSSPTKPTSWEKWIIRVNAGELQARRSGGPTSGSDYAHKVDTLDPHKDEQDGGDAGGWSSRWYLHVIFRGCS